MGAVFALCCWLPADLWSRRRARRKEAAAASGSEADDAAAPGSEASAEGAPAPAPRAPSGRGAGRTTGNQVLVVALVLLAAVANLGRTVTYNRCWSNEFNLFSSGVHANPLAARAANNLAVILARGSHHDVRTVLVPRYRNARCPHLTVPITDSRTSTHVPVCCVHGAEASCLLHEHSSADGVA